jgi:TRAP-type C4-dicarboxylate transport system permease small subunit
VIKIKNWAWTFLKGFDSLTHVFHWVGYVSLVGIVVVTFIDVAGRYCLNKPLLGSLEILELAMAVLGGFAMFYTTTRGGHISVDLFYVRFSRRHQIVVDRFSSIVGFVAWGIIAYQVYLLGMRMLKSGDFTNLLHIPLYPFQFVFALGILLYSLALLRKTLRPLISNEPEKKEGDLGI